MKKVLEIKQDAIFIADSHTQHGRDSLILSLEKLLKSPPSQIFLMGDISNILVGNLKSSLKSNEKLLNTLNSLSQKAQIIYFEGNHDFNLERILPNIIKIPRKNQPQLAHFGNQTALIAHGDIFLDKKYEIYIKILSAKVSAKILNALDLATFGRLYALIEKKVQSKKIRLLSDECAIHTLIKKRIQSYQNYISRHNLCVDFVIEGHFHLGKIVLDCAKYLDSATFAKNPLDSANRINSAESNKISAKSFSDSANLAESRGFSYIALPAYYLQNLAFKIKNCEFIRL